MYFNFNKRLNMHDNNTSTENSTKTDKALVPIDHFTWLLKQSGDVRRLYFECAAADPMGTNFVDFETQLCDISFKRARGVLALSGFFKFQKRTGTLPDGNQGVIGYSVRNCFGLCTPYCEGINILDYLI